MVVSRLTIPWDTRCQKRIDGIVYYSSIPHSKWRGPYAGYPLTQQSVRDLQEFAASSNAVMKSFKSIITLLLTCYGTLPSDVTVMAYESPRTSEKQNVEHAQGRLLRSFEENGRLGRRQDASLPTGCDTVPIKVEFPETGEVFVAFDSMCLCAVDGALTAESSARLDNALRTDPRAIAAQDALCRSRGLDWNREECAGYAVEEFVYFAQDIYVSLPRDVDGRESALLMAVFWIVPTAQETAKHLQLPFERFHAGMWRRVCIR